MCLYVNGMIKSDILFLWQEHSIMNERSGRVYNLKYINIVLSEQKYIPTVRHGKLEIINYIPYFLLVTVPQPVIQSTLHNKVLVYRKDKIVQQDMKLKKLLNEWTLLFLEWH